MVLQCEIKKGRTDVLKHGMDHELKPCRYSRSASLTVPYFRGPSSTLYNQVHESNIWKGNSPKNMRSKNRGRECRRKERTSRSSGMNRAKAEGPLSGQKFEEQWSNSTSQRQTHRRIHLCMQTIRSGNERNPKDLAISNPTIQLYYIQRVGPILEQDKSCNHESPW